MNGIGAPRFTTYSVLFGIACFNAPCCRAGENGPPSAIEKYDCGTIALHTMLALEGRATHIDILRARLPAPSPHGHSMAELRDAAHAFGLSLMGVKFSRTDRAPDRPVLVFFRRDDHGHFLVVRPVGHSGKMIQIIDSKGDPVVLDAVELYGSPQWTGLALIPSRPNWPLRIAVGGLTVSGLTLILLLVASRFRAGIGRTVGKSVSATLQPASEPVTEPP